MVRRKRTALENAFNLNRYRKRKGAKALGKSLQAPEYAQLKAHILDGEPVENFQSYMIKDLQTHFTHLQKNFIGQPELCFYHAKLIVLIRREADLTTNLALFNDLWAQESDFLLQHLNFRWLASAIDTFIDHSNDATFRAILLNAIVLINTVKLYETERFYLNMHRTTIDDYQAEQLAAAKDCFDLFDQLPSFRVGVDDTLRNMRWRMDSVLKQHPLGQQIFMEVFERMNTKGSVYCRFKNAHHKPRTEWW